MSFDVWTKDKKALKRRLKIVLPKQMETVALNSGFIQKCVTGFLPVCTISLNKNKTRDRFQHISQLLGLKMLQVRKNTGNILI